MSSHAMQYRNAGELDTPYARAAQEWDDRIGSARVQARNWRRIAFATTLSMLVSVLGLIYLGMQPKRVPYIVEIDRLGQTSVRGELGHTTFTPTATQIKYHLDRFVRATRSVSSDQGINQAAKQEAYAVLTPRAGNMLTVYIKGGGDPAKRAALETDTVEIVNEVQVSEGIYQIDWREKAWDLSGKLTRDEVWRGMFQVQMHPITDVKDIRTNPIGLFVDEFHWDRVGEEQHVRR